MIIEAKPVINEVSIDLFDIYEYKDAQAVDRSIVQVKTLVRTLSKSQLESEINMLTSRLVQLNADLQLITTAL